jgi:hypothetical protein
MVSLPLDLWAVSVAAPVGSAGDSIEVIAAEPEITEFAVAERIEFAECLCPPAAFSEDFLEPVEDAVDRAEGADAGFGSCHALNTPK